MKAKRELHGGESKHLKRLGVTAVAILAVLIAFLIIAKLLGEFT